MRSGQGRSCYGVSCFRASLGISRCGTSTSAMSITNICDRMVVPESTRGAVEVTDGIIFDVDKPQKWLQLNDLQILIPGSDTDVSPSRPDVLARKHVVHPPCRHSSRRSRSASSADGASTRKEGSSCPDEPSSRLAARQGATATPAAPRTPAAAACVARPSVNRYAANRASCSRSC